MSLTRPIRFISAAPRSHLFTRHTGFRTTAPLTRNIGSTPLLSQDQQPSNPFSGGPAPPRLPREEQEIFETLQRQSTGAFSTPRSPPQINQSPDSTAADRAAADREISARADGLAGPEQAQSKFKEEYERVIEARGKGEELHPNVRRGAQPEFDGDVNPKTGEVGGPKNDPLRWGAAGEWTYNGRTTDF